MEFRVWRLRTFVLLLATAATHMAHAQGATDNELYAGYCAGVLSGEDQTSDVQRMKQRFMTYPWMTGAMTVLDGATLCSALALHTPEALQKGDNAPLQ